MHTFLQECGMGLVDAVNTTQFLFKICDDTDKYNHFVGILNNIRLETVENVDRESGSEPD